MENVELDSLLLSKLSAVFKVGSDDVNAILSFFNTKLKPAIKIHYLSHLVSSIEEMINEDLKQKYIDYIESEAKKFGDNSSDLIAAINEKRIRLFTISLKPLADVKRKAKAYIMKGGVVIFYAAYLTENEKRFVIAHELGHIVSHYLLKNGEGKLNDYPENVASLFAYIALLDKNNFYINECKNYISKNDISLFDEYVNLIH